MNQEELEKSFKNHTLPEDPNEAFVINGIRFNNRKEYDDRVETDAHKLAELLYDMYKDKKHDS